MRCIALVLVILLTETSLSFAQDHKGTPQEQQACTRDAQRFCRQQLGDDGAVQQCLQQNRTRLSKNCQKVFASHGM
jgi:Cysteine rich repeat